MKIQLVQGTNYVAKDGKSYGPGDVLDLDQDAAEALIRTGSAAAVAVYDGVLDHEEIAKAMKEPGELRRLEEEQHGGN